MVTSCPVAQHRWFEKGAGWAFDQALSSRLPQLTVILETELKKPVSSREVISVCYPAFGGWIVGERVPDQSPPDPKAVARGGAFVLRVALLEQHLEPNLDLQAEICKKLRLLPTPCRGNQDLVIEIVSTATVTEEPRSGFDISRSGSTSGHGLWLALPVLICGAMISVQSMAIFIYGQKSTLFVSLVSAIGGILVFIVFGRFWQSLIKQLGDQHFLASRLENKWNSWVLRPQSDWNKLIVQDWFGIVDGEKVLAKTHDMTAMVRFPSIDVSSPESSVLFHEKTLLIYGRNFEYPVGFHTPSKNWLHVYTKIGEAWLMVAAVETPEPSTERSSEVAASRAEPTAVSQRIVQKHDNQKGPLSGLSTNPQQIDHSKISLELSQTSTEQDKVKKSLQSESVLIDENPQKLLHLTSIIELPIKTKCDNQ